MLSPDELLHEIMREVELMNHVLTKQVSFGSDYININKSINKIKYFYSQHAIAEKFSSNKFQISNVKTNVSELILNSLEEVSVIFINHFQEIKTEIELDLFLETDPLLCRIVFLNLLENAFKYGNGSLCVSLQKDDSSFLLEIVNNYKSKDPIHFSTHNGLFIVRKMVEKLSGLYEENISPDEWRTSLIFKR